MLKYLSFGGGVNSVALYLLLLEQGLQPGDPVGGFEAVFVDHETDWPETYKYFENFVKKYPVTVIKPNKNGFSSLLEYCEHYNFLPYIMRRFCTVEFKIKPYQNYVQKPCWSNIGIDSDEAHRAKISHDKGIENRWPLLEAEMGRTECIELIRRHGLSVPPKSKCILCPFQSRAEFKRLRREEPCLFARLQKIEKNMRRRKNTYTLVKGIKLDDLSGENQGRLPGYELPPCQCEF